MTFTLSAVPDATLPFDDIIDVRAPAEYTEDHIPGAINLPVLSDAERAKVGTVYVRQDRFLARKIGAALVARNAAAHIEGALADRDGAWHPLVYCWRGGQRSGSFASILSQIGWRVEVLDGGYKSYRRMVAKRVYDDPLGSRLVIIDGGTGSGKTQLLAALSEAGAQVIDLEGLAHHRGSNFGGWAEAQPSQKMFESRLAQVLQTHDPARCVFVEAESNAIGKLLIPPTLWKDMGSAPVIRLDVPVPVRARFLTAAYPDLTTNLDLLRERVEALRPYHPRDRIDGWHTLAANRAFTALASELIAAHYDPRYVRSNRPARPQLGTLPMSGLDDADIARGAQQVLDMVRAAGLTP